MAGYESKSGARVARVKLPEDLRKQIVEQLGIRNHDRVPKELVVTGLPAEFGKALPGGADQVRSFINDVLVA